MSEERGDCYESFPICGPVESEFGELLEFVVGEFGRTSSACPTTGRCYAVGCTWCVGATRGSRRRSESGGSRGRGLVSFEEFGEKVGEQLLAMRLGELPAAEPVDLVSGEP